MDLSEEARFALRHIVSRWQALDSHAAAVIPASLYRTERSPERTIAGVPVPIIEAHTLTDEGWALAEAERANEPEPAKPPRAPKPKRIKWEVGQ